MKITKKLFAALLACMMIFSALSCVAFADEDSITMLDVWTMLSGKNYANGQKTVKAAGEAGSESFVFNAPDMQEYVIPVSDFMLSFNEDWLTYVYDSDELYIEADVRDGGLYYIAFSGAYDTSDDYTYDYDGVYIEADRERDGSTYYPWLVGATEDDYVCASYYDGWLDISGTGNMMDFDTLEDRPWNDVADSVMSIMVYEGVTGIGKNAFNGLGGSEFGLFLTLGGDITSIGESAFEDIKTDEFTNIDLPASVASIGSRAFADILIDTISFMGNKCEIADDAFSGVTATISTVFGTDWTDADKLDYGGELTYETCYILELEVYSSDESFVTSTAYIPEGILDGYMLFSPDESFEFVSFELIEGTLPDGIDLNDPELSFTMTDNLKLKVYYEYVGESEDVDPDEPDPTDKPSGILDFIKNISFEKFGEWLHSFTEYIQSVDFVNLFNKTVGYISDGLKKLIVC